MVGQLEGEGSAFEQIQSNTINLIKGMNGWLVSLEGACVQTHLIKHRGVHSDTLDLKQGRVLKRGLRSTCSKMGGAYE